MGNGKNPSNLYAPTRGQWFLVGRGHVITLATIQRTTEIGNDRIKIIARFFSELTDVDAMVPPANQSEAGEEIGPMEVYPPRQETLANAWLMKCSPAMLETLRLLKHVISIGVESRNVSLAIIEDLEKQLEAGGIEL